ncbi:ABC transporter C family member 1, putative [Plasmodium malariae]|uniref:ABC transporter C family member 1, putative n=1 Tax=Plasmodium malariae TaxID=5858 RepID=A0A1D3JKT4_PLAMA|nr:ABC transporter C family member 1, putative [Plasmodium malariae]SBT87074.1 ABC transporter C family member 1, putative [Plasmodium malariae]
MTKYEKKEKNLNNNNEKKQTEYVSFFSFITFHWVTRLLYNINKEEIKFPELRKKSYVIYYTSKLEENLRKITAKKYSFNKFYKKKEVDVKIPSNSKDIKKNKEYNIHYNNILWSIFKTFKVPIILIIFFNILHTFFIIITGGCIDKYMFILRDKIIASYPVFLNSSKVIFGLYIVALLFIEFLFDSILNFYYYEFLVNMEISLIHFLYRINLYSYNNNLINQYINKDGGDYLYVLADDIKRDYSYNKINETFCGINEYYGKNIDLLFNKNFYKINFFKKKNMIREEDKIEKEDASNLNIYNIMFSDVPSLVLFVGAIISLCSIIVKFHISFYVFYLRMGSKAVKTGVSLSIVLYSIMILFEFLPSLFKNKYLKYRDKRIDNMHHVLKEFKLIKMFNWESFAFNYINFFRIKEMKFCKIRLYLGTVGIFINAVSSDIVEVVLFFFFIREKLDNKKEINFSSIIMPLYVYKSLISSVSNFPNLMNHLIEGIVNIKRITKYVNYHLYYSDINNYFKYFLKNNNCSNILHVTTCLHSDTEYYPTYRKYYKKLKKRLRKILCFLFFSKRSKHIDIINRKILSDLYYNRDKNVKKICFQTRFNSRNNDNNIYVKKEKRNNNHIIITENKETDIIIKLQNCSFGQIKKGDNKFNYILKNTNFNLKNNTIAIIIGNVGSGKTSFFQSILGKLKLIHGCFYVKSFLYNMPILYVPQDCWLSIGHIRSMILFGNEYNSQIYRYTIVQSELLNDLASFKNGDMRYINDEHNLSKGQRVRISLARALYHHYMHMYKFSVCCEKDIYVNKSIKKEISANEFLNDLNDECTFLNHIVPFSEHSMKTYLIEKNIFYLYLLDDVFTSLDPAISKNIFYNLFCKEENKSFKDCCSFVVSMNESTFSNFLTNDIIDNIQYTVDIYELESETLKYRGSISEYIERNNINMKKENNFNKTEINIAYTKLKLGDETEECNKKHNETEYAKCSIIPLKGINENDSFTINNVSDVESKKSCSFNSLYLKNTYIFNMNKKLNSDNIKKLVGEQYYIHENRNVKKSTSLEFRYNDSVTPSGASDSDEDSIFKGNIQLKTYTWYFRKVGYVVLLYILIFMFISIFTDEIKFFILSMISIISRNDKKHSNEILQQQAKYLKLFVILPIISVIASFFCFMFIIYGTVTSAVKVHTDVLNCILRAPIYIYYNSNLGNIINRFVTDIYSLDNGFLKRIYKVIFLFFRLFFSVILLFFMMKDSVIIFPLIVFLIYFFVFKKYSEGCKEAQRGYLRCHSPLCNIYSNTILGKNIINLYEKNSYYLSVYAHYVDTLRNYYLLKWAITIWASFYIRLIVLILTTYFIMHPQIFFNGKNKQPGEKNDEKLISTVGYCITFSSRLGILTKILLSDYTFVEKEMCCVQRLEEFSELPNEKSCLDKEKELVAKCNEKRKNVVKIEVDGQNEVKNISNSDEDSSLPIINIPAYVDESKEKYGIYFENVFVSYKKKFLLDKNNCKYCYIDEEPSLKNINLYALKNQKIGIVGKSGSGKSTIILCILGLIDINSGKITIEGRDIRTIHRKEKNSIISVLPQSSFVFHNWNVRTFIDPYKNFTDKEIVESFNLIGINLSINDLDKYIYIKKEENVVNETRKKEKKKRKEKIDALSNTIPLTDGCIRYLSLVRLYLNRNKYKFILIDEIPTFAFNNIDSYFNHFLNSNAKPFNYIIRNYFPNNTVLIISHDTNTLSCCDFIYVLKNGEITYRCSCKDIKTQSELADLLEKDC